ncbi:MAG: cupredoxin domain-containing protein [Mycobacteriales bacterium]
MRSAAVLAAAAGCVLLAGCGGGPAAPRIAESSRPDQVTVAPGPDGVQVVDVDADDANRFHPSLIEARPGPVQLTLHHVGKGAPHNWTARDLPGGRVPLVRGGESRTVRFRIGRPGDYRFVCTIHEAQGSVGRLVVRAAP